jgi:hypothetical protein
MFLSNEVFKLFALVFNPSLIYGLLTVVITPSYILKQHRYEKIDASVTHQGELYRYLARFQIKYTREYPEIY